jgi:NADH dehydrogenase
MSKHVVVIGGGFGGLHTVRGLHDADVEITILDRRNHHVFQPLLYQVATAALNPADIAYPIRSILSRQKNAEVILGEVIGIDTAGKKLKLADGGEMAWDFLVVAAGATHSYFGHDAWAEFAPGLKTVEDATDIRARILYAFEAAERETDAARRAAWLTFVVVGGGPTGVEIAGALGEVARHALARDFRHIDPKQARILLVEGGPRVLSVYPESLSAKAVAQLEQLGVEVRTQTQVTNIDNRGVDTKTGRIDAFTVIWGAGVKASPLGAMLDAPIDRAGRVQVTERLTLPNNDDVWAIGDMAAVSSEGKPVPGVAPAAMQMGDYVAASIKRRISSDDHGTPEPFVYWDKGSFATIGRSKAVGELPHGILLSGFLAWVAWLTIHIFFLIGFRNRVIVLWEWFWAYITFQRGARLITDEPRRKLRH